MLKHLNRRQMLKHAAAATVASSLWQSSTTRADEPPKRSFKIGACDWSIGMGGQLGALSRAKEIGLDGVQVSFGAPGGKNDLRQPASREQYIKKSKTHGIEIASLAMGLLNSVPFATDERAPQWVAQCIDVLPLLGQKVVLLAFFGKGDIQGKPDLQKQVIARLKQLAPKAEKAGVVLGLETWLGVGDHLRILDAVGSPSVQVYYDTANMEKRGYDIYSEIRKLGKERICEIHCKENGSLLGQGRVDFRKVKDALDDIGWNGYLVIEGAVPKGQGVVEAYKKNQNYLRSVFLT